ncbi:polysaccharide lyase 8 family protein [Rugosimonospora africana]|uniref:Polysaccharide lyase n=1 Tax=Rugosimonospora africana TaxID=556532 RepID=A0A8J3VV42_9ACTN|nr:polysaccharide lyase 8 family protein [Rugosimonospora africana]GIH19539.1 polysaccharide lyase [Rugosimonospora africana]
MRTGSQNPNALSRRTVLRAGAVTAAGVAGALPAVSAASAAFGSDHLAADDFAQMRQQWRSLYVTSGYDTNDPDLAPVPTQVTDTAQQWWSSMAKSSSRSYLWSDAQVSVQQSFAIADSFARLRSMALAWATPGSGLFGNATLLTDTIGGLDWVVANWYNENRAEVGNWYEWEISGPRALNDAAVILFDRLTSTQLQAYGRATAHYTPAPSGTAANRALTSHVVVGRGALLGNGTTVASGVSGLSSVLVYVTSAEGFYRDGSFIQHSCYPYAGAYGELLLEALAPLLATVAGTQWQVDAAIVAEWIRDAFDPLIWRGCIMDTVMGRTIARPDQQNSYWASGILAAALDLVPAVPDAQQPWLRSVLKEWILADGTGDPLPDRDVPLRLTAAALRDDSTIGRRGPLVGSRVYNNQDRIVHRQANWALGIGMFSSRIGNYESINSENLHGWCTADGATYLYVGNGTEFSDAYWPTVDSTRIPGTTADTRTRTDAEGKGYLGGYNWAGGANALGRYTAGGLNLDAQGCSLVAKKSWFCFDDEVVALGAGITATDGRRINTYVESRKITGTEKLLANGAEIVAAPGWAELAGTKWIHITGVGGYIFPTPTQVDFWRQSRTGRWTDINKNSFYADQTAQLTRNYLSAFIEHGVNPTNASYAYVILPTATPDQTAQYAQTPNIQVIANTATVQAARCLSSGVLGINFWAAGTASIVTSQDAGSVVVVQQGGQLTLAVADPTHKATQVRLTLAVAAQSVVTADPNVTVVSLNPLKVTVNVSGAAGATRSIRLTY